MNLSVHSGQGLSIYDIHLPILWSAILTYIIFPMVHCQSSCLQSPLFLHGDRRAPWSQGAVQGMQIAAVCQPFVRFSSLVRCLFSPVKFSFLISFNQKYAIFVCWEKKLSIVRNAFSIFGADILDWRG